jgi:hypothetical protein
MGYKMTKQEEEARNARIAHKSAENNPEGVARVKAAIAKIRKRMKFAWASIAGADLEPVEIVRDESGDVIGILTCGCPDPFLLTDQAAVVVIYEELDRPDNPQTLEQRERASIKYEKERGITHGWRGQR